jgi:hypothetical protein
MKRKILPNLDKAATLPKPLRYQVGTKKQKVHELGPNYGINNFKRHQ